LRRRNETLWRGTYIKRRRRGQGASTNDWPLPAGGRTSLSIEAVFSNTSIYYYVLV
jgi:hypothetical protein